VDVTVRPLWSGRNGSITVGMLGWAALRREWSVMMPWSQNSRTKVVLQRHPFLCWNMFPQQQNAHSSWVSDKFSYRTKPRVCSLSHDHIKQLFISVYISLEMWVKCKKFYTEEISRHFSFYFPAIVSELWQTSRVE
jgi:hypothetical protein